MTRQRGGLGIEVATILGAKQPHKQPHENLGGSVESAMLFVAVLFLAFCVILGTLGQEFWKVFLLLAWSAMGLMVIASLARSLLLLF